MYTYYNNYNYKLFTICNKRKLEKTKIMATLHWKPLYPGTSIYIMCNFIMIIKFVESFFFNNEKLPSVPPWTFPCQFWINVNGCFIDSAGYRYSARHLCILIPLVYCNTILCINKIVLIKNPLSFFYLNDYQTLMSTTRKPYLNVWNGKKQ